MRLDSSISDAAELSRTGATTRYHLPVSLRRGPVLWLILSGVLLVAAITIGTAVMVGEYRERALSNGERELENTVLLLSRHFDQEMEDAEIRRRQSHLTTGGLRDRIAGGFQGAAVRPRRASDVEVEGERPVLSR